MTSTFVPIAPSAGWQSADRGRRFAALLALPFAALLALVVLTRPGSLPSPVVLGWLVVGPACCYSLARVVRPEPVSAERTPRHLLAATAVAFAVPSLADMTHTEVGAQFLFGPPAFVFGVVTSTWGVAALVVRAVRRIQTA